MTDAAEIEQAVFELAKEIAKAQEYLRGNETRRKRFMHALFNVLRSYYEKVVKPCLEQARDPKALLLRDIIDAYISYAESLLHEVRDVSELEKELIKLAKEINHVVRYHGGEYYAVPVKVVRERLGVDNARLLAQALGLEYGPVKFQGKTTRCVLVPREVVEQS